MYIVRITHRAKKTLTRETFKFKKNPSLNGLSPYV